jgi:hypothetical protein
VQDAHWKAFDSEVDERQDAERKLK